MAFLAGYEQLKDARDLEAASRLMGHLTGAGWGFFGSRYYYGKEHWTCQAVGKAAAHMPVESALDFCLLVTQRRHRADTAVSAVGPGAKQWLTIAQAFAGPPGAGRAAGQFDSRAE